MELDQRCLQIEFQAFVSFYAFLEVSQEKEKEMATHSSTLAWKIPWMEEPGAAVPGVAASRTRLSGFAFTFHFHHWRRKWQPTPVFLPEESQGQRSLVGFRLWGRIELDTTDATQQQQQQQRYHTWNRVWQPTSVLLPGESHKQRSLEGCDVGLQRVGHD